MNWNCKTGKICYKTKVDAEFALYRRGKLRNEGKTDRQEKYCYHCLFCGNFHLTKQPQLETWNSYHNKRKRHGK